MKLEETLRLRVPAEVKELLETQADSLDRSVGWLVRNILTVYAEKLKAEQAALVALQKKAADAEALASWPAMS